MPTARFLAALSEAKNNENDNMKKPFLVNNYMKSENTNAVSTQKSENNNTNGFNLHSLKALKSKGLNDKTAENGNVKNSDESSKARPNSSLKRFKRLASTPSVNTPRSISSASTAINFTSKSFESDDDLFDSDEDEKEQEQETPRTRSQHLWSQFEDSIKKIHDQTESLTLQARPTFNSSDVYKGVMKDMFGNTEYGHSKGYTILKDRINRLTNVTSLTSRLFSKITKDPDSVDSLEEDDDSELNAKEDRKEMESEMKGAKRGWKLLKRHVNETALQEKTKDTNVKWNMIRHHVTMMSDQERARQDLYERYGVLPTLQKDGTMQCKNVMWSQRAISLNQTSPAYYNIPSKNNGKRKKSKRSQSARPATTSGASQTNGLKRSVSSRPTSERYIKSRSASSIKL